MRNKTIFEKLIRATWQKTRKGSVIETQEDAVVLFAIILTLNHLKSLDKTKGTEHRKCFCRCYLTTYRMFQFEVAFEFFHSEDTVSDFCKMYMDIFEGNLVLARGLKIEIYGALRLVNELAKLLSDCSNNGFLSKNREK